MTDRNIPSNLRLYALKRRPRVATLITKELVDAHILDDVPLPEGLRVGGCSYHPDDRIVHNAQLFCKTKSTSGLPVAIGEWFLGPDELGNCDTVQGWVFERDWEPYSAGETTVEPASVLAWAVRSFGAIALNRDERAARMAEEAVEVAQVEGVPLDVMQRITARVYSRPVGELGQEIGGLMVGLYALAARAGVDIEAEFKREFTRVLSKPADWWARKHAEKVAAGTADLTPVKTSAEPHHGQPIDKPPQ